jgi:hypothetical protein
MLFLRDRLLNNDFRDVQQWETFMFYANYLMDLTRFIYGRGVLFKLSNFGVFLCLVMKDSLYSKIKNVERNDSEQ